MLIHRESRLILSKIILYLLSRLTGYGTHVPKKIVNVAKKHLQKPSVGRTSFIFYILDNRRSAIDRGFTPVRGGGHNGLDVSDGDVI